MTNLTRKKAPNFILMSTSGNKIDLYKIKTNYIVLYFYPKDDTPGCTLETKDFNSLLSKFKKYDCSIFGISKDNLKSHLKFKKSMVLNLNFWQMKKKK